MKTESVLAKQKVFCQKGPNRQKLSISLTKGPGAQPSIMARTM